MGVKAWCTEYGIALKTYYSWERQIVKEATRKYALPAPAQTWTGMEKVSGQWYTICIEGEDSMPSNNSKYTQEMREQTAEYILRRE